MRATGAEIGAQEPRLSFAFEGSVFAAREGETIAAALTAVGELGLRTARDGQARGLFCGMGVCQECLVEVDGGPAVRACMTKVEAGMNVRRNIQPGRVPTRIPQVEPASAPDTSPDILVIGGGPAGLTAAIAARGVGATVTLVDERPVPGGQYFKQPHQGLPPGSWSDDHQFTEGRKLIAAARACGVTFIEGSVADASAPLSIGVVTAAGRATFSPRRLIVATGAYERGWPVPGWTLPGVITTGAAQTLLRSYRVLPGKRVVVAGNGPLNLQVAVELARSGAEVVAVCEAGPRPGLRHAGPLAAMALSSPTLLLQGLSYLAELRRRKIPLHFATAVSRIEEGLKAVITGPAGALEIAADAICLGYGFLPSNEVLRLLGCRHDYDERRRHLVTRRDDAMRTSVAGVYAVGDCCGLGGARAAMAEARIAGMAAARDAVGAAQSPRQGQEIEAVRRQLARQRRFQRALWTLFAPVVPSTEYSADTVICRCEGVTFAEIGAIAAGGGDGIGALKRQSRLGMGRCQGRYCVAEAVAYLWRDGEAPTEMSFAAPRPPVKPVSLTMLHGPSAAGEPTQV